MTADDSLKITQNEDGSFTMDWDPQDSKWSWLNGLTQKEVQVIMEQAIKDYLDELDQSPAVTFPTRSILLNNLITGSMML
jgi:hypothetical protein